MYNAGADPNYKPFIDSPVSTALGMVHRNCMVSTELCHHYGAAMVTRQRGGIIVVSSGAAFAGAPNTVAYGASKAFDMVVAEALWTELHPHGVDVLSLILGETDAPALRLRAERGQADDPDLPLPGVTTVDEVVADAVERLSQEPSWMVGEQLREGAEVLIGGMSRNCLVGVMVQVAQGAMSERRWGRQAGHRRGAPPLCHRHRHPRLGPLPLLLRRRPPGGVRRDRHLGQCGCHHGVHGSQPCGHGPHMHQLSNLAITIDGDEANARSYVDGVLMAADGGLNPRGSYEDRLVRTAAGWRIIYRRYTMVHFGTI
jgi:short chain dehydrogenase/SnoaL-like domain